jgi:hypothetical protein
MEAASRVEFAEAQAAAGMEDRGVTDSILITAARYVFHHEPAWRDKLPTSVQRAAGDRRIPHPAAVGLDEPDGATSNTVYCWVWTRESYRAPTLRSATTRCGV